MVLYALNEAQTTFSSKEFQNLNWWRMIPYDFPRRIFLRILLVKCQMDIYWITEWNGRLADWNRWKEPGWKASEGNWWCHWSMEFKAGEILEGEHSLSLFTMKASTMDDTTQYYCVLLRTHSVATFFVVAKIGICDKSCKNHNISYEEIIKGVQSTKNCTEDKQDFLKSRVYYVIFVFMVT